MTPTEKSESVNFTENIKRNFRFELAPSTMITLIVVLAALWVLFKLVPVLLVLIAAFFAVGTLNPVVQWLESKRVSRRLAIAIVFVSLLIIILGGAILTIPALLVQASTIMEQEPVLRGQLADWLSRFPLSEGLVKWLRHIKYGGPASTADATAYVYSVAAMRFVAYAFSAISLALYIMIDRDRLRGGFFAIIPRSHHIRLSRILMSLENIVGAYIRAQLITSIAVGLFIFTLLAACGVENAMALAVFGAIIDILPYVGVFLYIAATVLSAVPHGPVVTIVVFSLMFIYMEFEGRALVPRVYGRALRLPSTVVLFSLLIGGTLMGIIGALLALPFAAAVMMLVEELRMKLPGEQAQAADEVLRKGDDKAEEEYERRAEGVSTEQSAAIAVEISGDRVKEESQLLKKADP